MDPSLEAVFWRFVLLGCLKRVDRPERRNFLVTYLLACTTMEPAQVFQHGEGGVVLENLAGDPQGG